MVGWYDSFLLHAYDFSLKFEEINAHGSVVIKALDTSPAAFVAFLFLSSAILSSFYYLMTKHCLFMVSSRHGANTDSLFVLFKGILF